MNQHSFGHNVRILKQWHTVFLQSFLTTALQRHFRASWVPVLSVYSISCWTSLSQHISSDRHCQLGLSITCWRGGCCLRTQWLTCSRDQINFCYQLSISLSTLSIYQLSHHQLFLSSISQSNIPTLLLSTKYLWSTHHLSITCLTMHYLSLSHYCFSGYRLSAVQ